MATKDALVIASTVEALIGQFRAHMLGRSLPAPAYVHLEVSAGRVSVQVDYGRNTSERLGNLLLWAHTLDEVTVEWWRTSADNLHITVQGRTSSGLRMRLYTGVPFEETVGLVRLQPDERELASLDELYALAGLVREAQPGQGAAW
jgi:hypothetical protein